jgi:nucleotide-binding universal stress UspA family protein
VQEIAMGDSFSKKVDHDGVMVEKIILPFDFSECSRQALNYAISFAKQFNAKILLLHVMALSPYVPEIAISIESDQVGLKKKLDEKVRGEVLKIQEQGIETEGFCIIGEPHTEIIEFAVKEHADMIIMGTHGRTGLTHILLGSTAERVIERAPCPVLTLKLGNIAGPKFTTKMAVLAQPEPVRIPQQALKSLGTCHVCSEPAEDIICDSCKAHIQAEAFEQKTKIEKAGKVDASRS